MKKALTIKETDETIGNFSKEEIQRYQNRLNTLETEVINSEIEIEKLNRNQEYLKNLIKNKNEIISKLEFQIESQQCLEEAAGISKKCINHMIETNEIL